MSMGSTPNGSSTQQSTVQSQLPQNIQNFANTVDTNAFNIAQNGLGPYTGATYQPMTNGAYADIAGIQGLVGQSQPAFNLAQGTAANLTGYQAPTVNPGQIASTDLSAYENPFTSQVIGSGMQAIDAQRQQALNANADQARSQGAFGGSRQGVMEGATNAGAALQAGQLASQLQSQNFTQAQAAANQDIQTNLAGQTTNANNANTAAGLQLNAANSLGGLSTANQAAQESAFMNALTGQGMAQQDQQGMLSANQTAYNNAAQYPYQQEQLLLAALAGTPYPSSQTTTGATAQSAPGNAAGQTASTAIGALTSAASIAAAFA